MALAGLWENCRDRSTECLGLRPKTSARRTPAPSKKAGRTVEQAPSPTVGSPGGRDGCFLQT